MKKIKLNFIYLFFHYIVSILLLTGGPFFLISFFLGTFNSQSWNLAFFGLIMTVIGIFNVIHETNALKFSRFDLNGNDKTLANQYFLEILKKNNWKIELETANEIKATGFTVDKKSTLFDSSKQLTIKFNEQSVFINCIVEPPTSNQITFGKNKAIVKKLTDKFLEKFE